MKPYHAIFAALAATSIFALASSSRAPLPPGWVVAGESPEQYEAGVDLTQTISGKGAKYIHNVAGDGKSWGTLMQMFSAEKYRGQRVRLRARVKTKEVSGWAGLWMRVDVPGQRSVLYNSQDKPIKGSADWQQRSVVLDVGPGANALAFGVIQNGSGEVWIDDVKLDVVDRTVPVDVMSRPALPAGPTL